MSRAVDFLVDLAAGLVGEAAATILVYFLLTLAVFAFVLAVAPLYVWGMRKIMAHVQHRVGPYRVGPFGLLQPLADGIKLATKEDIIPGGVDRFTWSLAVYMLLIPVLVVFLFLPWNQGLVVANVGTGIILVLAIGAISPLGEILAGWGSNNKYSILGGIRAAALDVAYEVPLVIAAASVVLVAGTMNMEGIVEAQSTLWFALVMPIGFFIFIVAGLAKIGIAPIDLPEAESELVAGFHTEYSGMRFGMLFLTVFANIILISALTVTLFLGGWQGPIIDGFHWFMLKLVLVSVFILVTWFTLPRIRIDQFLSMGWKVLFPLSLVNLVMAAIVAKQFGGLF